MAAPADEAVRLRQHIAELEAELGRCTRRAREVEEELQHLVYAISHDLRESSRMVRSYTQLLAHRYEDKLGEDAREFIAFALNGVERMDEYLNDLLAYSRVVNAPMRPAREVSAEGALAWALAKLDSQIRQTGATVTHEPLPLVHSDEAHLSQLFCELIENSLKFRGSRRPEVHVSTSHAGSEWQFTVRDNGEGIDPRYFDQIFTAFRRLHGRDVPGTGIGLALARKIVERYGGRIWVESEPGSGTAVHFTLPE